MVNNRKYRNMALLSAMMSALPTTTMPTTMADAAAWQGEPGMVGLAT